MTTTRAAGGVAGHELVLVDAPDPALAGRDTDMTGAGSQNNVVAALVPRVGQAISQGRQVVLALEAEVASRVLAALGSPSSVPVVGEPDVMARPAELLDEKLRTISEHQERGVQLHLFHQAPVMASAVWSEWLRVEACFNLYAAGTWQSCVYPLAALGPELYGGLHATHDLVGTAAQTIPNAAYHDPNAVLAAHRRRPAPTGSWGLPGSLAERQLVDPSAQVTRRAITETARHTTLAEGAIEDMVLAASEVVTNARLHGRPPVEVGIWALPDRMRVSVADTGAGPPDPLVGLGEPAPSMEGGRGWWLVHRLVDVQHCTTSEGYAALLDVGARG